jgi:F-type H+-transporting ATPase subunit b
MERLLQPDTGLMIWTVVTFLALVFILKKAAWKPILQSLNDREAGIRRAIEEAQAARQAAEQLKAQYERDLAQGQEKSQAMLAQTAAEAQKLREKLLKEAEEDARKLAANTRRQLEDEKEKVMRDLRKEVAGISIKAAEKLVRNSMNAKVQEDLLKGFFEDLDKQKGN